MPQLVARPSDPLFVTRELDVFYIIAWGIYAAWGVAASIAGIPTITLASGELYNIIWAGLIAVTAVGALWSAVSIFYKTKLQQVVKKRIERTFLWVLMVLVAVYPSFLLITVIEGDTTRLATFIVSLLYLLIPYFRIRHLTKRIKYYASLSTNI